MPKQLETTKMTDWTYDKLIKAADALFANIKGQQAYLQYLQDKNYEQNYECEVEEAFKEMQAFNYYEKMGILDADLHVLAEILLSAIARQMQACDLDAFVKSQTDSEERVAAHAATSGIHQWCE
jgi:hypothetical protein